ncbi:MAG: hypothetical protein J3K34DRAFT_399037 [Monoraphidium minutum]|nr:MAG: hypothetical protein J3K34DRAFT_399037 [Monoraphidium minutum]
MLVVDPSFLERFRSAPAEVASPAYAALLAALPEVVVGGAEGLAPLVGFLCEQMEKAFRAAGGALPPWRTSEYMLAAWFPADAADEAPF